MKQFTSGVEGFPFMACPAEHCLEGGREHTGSYYKASGSQRLSIWQSEVNYEQ